MSTVPLAHPETAPAGRSNRWLYWGVGAVVIVLLAIGLISWNTERTTRVARDKAAQLTQRLQAAGLAVPVSQKAIARTLGEDGGPVCANPASALGKAMLNDMITNGADFVGRRPVIFDRRALLGELLILQTYCPEKVDAYRRALAALKLDTTIKR